MFRTKFNEESKEWSGESTESPWNGKTSLGIEIFNAFKLHSSKIAQVNPQKIFSYIPYLEFQSTPYTWLDLCHHWRHQNI